MTTEQALAMIIDVAREELNALWDLAQSEPDYINAYNDLATAFNVIDEPGEEYTLIEEQTT